MPPAKGGDLEDFGLAAETVPPKKAGSGFGLESETAAPTAKAGFGLGAETAAPKKSSGFGLEADLEPPKPAKPASSGFGLASETGASQPSRPGSNLPAAAPGGKLGRESLGLAAEISLAGPSDPKGVKDQAKGFGFPPQGDSQGLRDNLRGAGSRLPPPAAAPVGGRPPLRGEVEKFGLGEDVKAAAVGGLDAPPSRARVANNPQLDQMGKKAAGNLASRQTPSRVNTAQYDAAATKMTEDMAALTIQRHYKGFKTRMDMQQRYPQAQVFQRAGVPGAQGNPQQQQNRVRIVAPEPRNRLPAVPVIDVNRLPRFGVLAPPMPRPPRQAGKVVVYDKATHTFAKNRGVLREALENKSGWVEDIAHRMWAEFTQRQKDRYVPIPPDLNRRVLPDTRGYRLRVLRINDLPLHTTYDGRTFEFQLGVSLYDEAYGTFYGNTVYSMSDGYDRNRAAQRNAIDLDFSFDVYYHTRVSDPRCMAVVEVIMLERMLDGVIKGQFSLGWALLPLFKMAGAAPGSPGGIALDGQAGKPLSVPLVAGTPRYLMFRNVYNEDLRPPKVVPNCSIMFQAEVYPAADAYIPLLPEDFLVTYSDVIPGLRRFDTSGQLSINTKTVISTLASPMLSPTYSVVLRRLQLALPIKVHDLLMSMDTKLALPMSGMPMQPPISNIAGPVPQDDLSSALKYIIRVSVHNGRTFVGPAYELINLTSLDVPGWKVLQVPAPDAVFDYVMGDAMTTIVVELLATPPQVVPPGAAPITYLLGTTTFVPFQFLSDDGSVAEVAVGVHRYSLEPRGKQPLLRDLPVLDWRAMLGDAMTHEVPTPMVEFQLFETGRQPIPPPLRAKFAVIEAQREEEAALGEQPLEEVLAPVPVPPEIAADIPPDLPPRGSPPPEAIHPEPSLFEPSISALQPRPSLDGMQPLQRERSRALDELTHSRVYDTSDRDALRDLASAMQRQIELLTRAVDELREERKSLRNSVIALTDRGPVEAPVDPRKSSTGPNAAVAVQRYYDDHKGRQGQLQPTPDEIRRLMDMPATTNFGDPTAFTGGPPPVPRDPSAAPSRVLMQQLYDAGMVEALPEDVQTLLRRRGAPRGPSATPVDLAIEARDARMASDVVFQFLAYRHHDTLNAPANVQSLYFTFQFYHFPPTTSDMAFLVQPQPSAEDDPMAGTRILVTNHPMKKGAGVVLKYCVDGTAEPTAVGQTVDQAGFEGAVSFASYLATKKLAIDVWDGESLLQVGTASVDLPPLLRQGRDFAELLVEVPVMDQSVVAPESGSQSFSVPGLNTVGGPGATSPTILSKGSIVLRVINIGREAKNGGDKAQPSAGDFDAAKPGKRVRVRAKPAWEVVNGPIARELANGEGPSSEWLQGGGGEAFLQEFDSFGRPVKRRPMASLQAGPATPLDAQRASTVGTTFGQGGQGTVDPAIEVKHRILERTHIKSARVQQLNTILDVDRQEDGDGLRQAPPPPGHGDDAFRRVQKQLLVDVSSARARRKADFIRDTLRRNMVVRRVIKPGYGEVVVYEHEFSNPYSQEMVFEVRISNPREVSVLSRLDEYRALHASGARFLGAPSVQPGAGAGGLDQEVLAGNRLFLQANERITLPFKLQSLQPPEGWNSQAAAVTQAPDSRSSPGKDQAKRGQQQGADGGASLGHTVTVELVSVSHDHPVLVLELHVVPRPLVIDRTFRFYHPERSLMRQTIKVKHLPGAETTFAGGVLRQLAVAASHPDVVTGAGAGGMAGGTDRDEVYIKYKCGGAPEVTHFYILLYTDRLLAKPVEVWQVFVHSLRKVDLRAMIGQTSQASVVVRGASASRRVAAYASHPDELQVSPDSFVLVAGSLTEVLLSFRPVTAGMKDIKVHLVDVETRELVYALIVAAEAQGPLITRTFEIELPAGTVANKKITYTNPYQQYRTFALRSNQPWLLQFTPARLQLPGGATRPVGMTFDGRAATTGVMDVLVFVNDEEDRTEECFKVRVRIYR